MTSAGLNIAQCRAEFSDLSERAHPTDPDKNWGRFQAVTKRHRWDGSKLVPLPAGRRALEQSEGK